MYHKMPKQYHPSKLIQTIVIDRKDLSDEFIEYDTCTLDGDHYKLPFGKLIILLLLNPWGQLWTTIRRYTPQKFIYYNSMVGVEFNIDVA